MTELTTWLAMWLTDVFLLATMLLVIVAVVLPRLRHSADRMALAWTAMIGLTLLVAITLLPAWPRMNVTSKFRTSHDQALEKIALAAASPIERSNAIVEEDRVVPQMLPPPLPENHGAPVTVRGDRAFDFSWQRVLAITWLSGASFAGLWILCGAVSAMRLLKRAKQAPQWVRQEFARLIGKNSRAPRLLASQEIGTAAAIGTLRPSILLPESSVDETNVRGVRAALAHEWAHICHGDLWLLALERMLLPVFFAHPLYWWLRRRVREDQELLADAAAAGEGAVEYAEALLAWAKTATLPRRTGLAALGMWENPRTLTRRVEMLLKSQSPIARRSSWRFRCVTLAAFLALVAGLSCLTLRSTSVRAQDSEREVVKSGPPAPRLRDASSQFSVQLELKLARVDPQQMEEVLNDLKSPTGTAKATLTNQGFQLWLDEQATAEVWKKIEALSSTKVESQPRIVTLSGRPASVQIGGEVPILETEEIVKGVRERRVEYRQFGTQIEVVPTVQTDKHDGSFKSVRLEVHLKNTRLLAPRPNTSLPGIAGQSFDFAVELKANQTFLIGQRVPMVADGSSESRYIFSITPIEVKPIPAEVVAAAAAESIRATPTKADGDRDLRAIQQRLQALQKYVDDYERDRARLKAENEQLRKQLEEIQSAKKASPFERKPKPNTTMIFALRYLAASEARRRLNSFGQPSEGKVLRPTIGVDERTNALIVSGDEQEIAFVRRFVEQYDQAKVKQMPAEPSPIGAPQAADSSASSRTAERLKQLDIQEAELVLRAAAAEYDQLQQLHKSGQAVTAELQAKQFAVERAKINLLRSQVVGDAQRLFELDLQDAEASLGAAQNDVDRFQAMANQNPGAKSQHEIRRAELILEKAKINVARAKARLETAAEQKPLEDAPQLRPGLPDFKR